jgi:uncharacterized 2Fe-2S/4Fe-4S cluster protein (DUF4445 family)
LEIANSVGVDIDAPCGGRETCGKCRVIIRHGADCLSSVKNSERRFLSDAEIEAGYRLGCCLSALQGDRVVLEIPEESQLGIQRLLVGGVEPEVALSPAVSKACAQLPMPGPHDIRADTERFLQAASEQLGMKLELMDYDALKTMPTVLREGKWKATAILHHGEIVATEPGEKLGRLYGFAVDIGTTKLAGYIVDLGTGRTVSTQSALNPQLKHGGDVLTRITFAMQSSKNLAELHHMLITAINRMISEVCKKLDLNEHEIYDVVVVGNTAMHHFFFNISPTSVGLAPYPAVVGRALNIKARDLGLRVNAGAYVHSPPNIAGFVGADAVADILATEMYKAEDLTLLIDVGTNVEIVLGNRNGLEACSTPAGPALEGSEIAFGMRAVAGAIESVWIDPRDMSIGYRTVGKETLPKGICGSGIIDAIAEMFKAGIITPSGQIKKDMDTDRVRVRNGLGEFVLAQRKRTAIGKDIVVTQNDVRKIQLAKAAVFTGVLMSMRHLGIKLADVKKVHVAGAFGTYLNPQSARNIGMYHDIPLNKIRFVGNAAGAGARALLKSAPLREVARDLAKKIVYFPIGDEKDFQTEFLNALYIPHKDLELFPSVKRLLAAS